MNACVYTCTHACVAHVWSRVWMWTHYATQRSEETLWVLFLILPNCLTQSCHRCISQSIRHSFFLPSVFPQDCFGITDAWATVSGSCLGSWCQDSGFQPCRASTYPHWGISQSCNASFICKCLCLHIFLVLFICV